MVKWVVGLIMVSVMTVAACSSKVVYKPQIIAASTPNAININTATADELEKLLHIGRKTAETMVQFRTENGPFRRVEQIMQIRGISEERFTEIRHFLKTE